VIGWLLRWWRGDFSATWWRDHDRAVRQQGIDDVCWKWPVRKE
jgi:hypothetical protein